MQVAVLGTGGAGRTLATAIAAAGNDVTVGTRDVASLLERNAEAAAWHRDNPAVELATFPAAAAGAELVLNATAGSASLAALQAAGARALAGKILMDVANPLDFSQGMPPSLTVVNTDSLAEQIQRTFPDARVVKALNTVNASVMVAPQDVGGGEHDTFVCGNDESAKARVTALLQEWFGWTSVIDLGDITAARALEMYLPLWVRILTVTGDAAFNVRIVRQTAPER